MINTSDDILGIIELINERRKSMTTTTAVTAPITRTDKRRSDIAELDIKRLDKTKAIFTEIAFRHKEAAPYLQTGIESADAAMKAIRDVMPATAEDEVEYDA